MKVRFRGAKILFVWVLWTGLIGSIVLSPLQGLQGSAPGGLQVSTALAQAQFTNFLYLPLILDVDPRNTPFGVETNSPLTNTSTADFIKDLEVGAVRMSLRISWRELQPVEGGPILWELLANVENELRILNAADIDAVMVITDSPLWAVLADPKDPTSIDGKSYCGPIASTKFDDFAYFISQLVARYSKPEFNVKIWELGNEPDVDPELVPADSVYGCWGDDEDPYYGGERYGRMLMAVTPSIKAADPQAQVWVGGLLLSRPDTLPRKFLEGILKAGAPPYSYFDAVPYHWYAWYDPPNEDNDTTIHYDYDLLDKYWGVLGGGAYAKADFLNDVLAKYGVSKPLILDEVALGCNNDWAPGNCYVDANQNLILSDMFLQSQANFIPRAAMRAMKAGVQQVYWFMLEENGWGYVGLLDIYRAPKPVYYAYRNLVAQYDEGAFLGQVTYSGGTEAYAVQRKDGKRMHVVWTVEDVTRQIQVPQAELVAIYNRDGAAVAKPVPVNGYYYITVGFSPLYLILTP